MMRRHAGILGVGIAGMMAASVSGCLFEAEIVEALNKDPTPTPSPPPVVAVPGAITIASVAGLTTAPAFHLYDVFGNEIPSTREETDTPGAYLLSVEDVTELTAGPVRLDAVAGDIVLKTVFPCLTEEDLDQGVTVDLDARTTAVAIVIEALGAFRGDAVDNPSLAPYGYMLQTFAADELALAMDNLGAELDSPGSDMGTFVAMVTAILGAGDETADGPLMFHSPVDGPSLLQADFLTAVAVDYDGDGVEDTAPDVFDSAAFALADAQRQAILEDVPLAQYTDADGVAHPYLTVVFTAHMEDGTCITTENACSGKWIHCDEGDSLYFTGGTHEDSPIQDVTFDEMMAQWTPNILPMYDDGTHGDVVAGDQIYTITFRFPEGLRIGYKYTYGAYGDGWNSTEEWPGNQRILEIVDLNGDGIVWRDDYVTDETTNKDKNNCNPVFGGCSGTIDWDTDLNGDGIPEAQEHPLSISVVDEENNLVELAGQCTYDAWIRHPLVTRATSTPCGESNGGDSN